ncbi:hypothetical protein O181_050824 [Austropuccinia psidii MF-1]|uniref:Uncharacterized protein n=1 Tax=Austropuccinia psidii MF-1 TaxID=1389203 RepID=A0A9Q3DXK1_9BASI|nr:hypothetical protein [Austropuccinia psidii MF-1]
MRISWEDGGWSTGRPSALLIYCWAESHALQAQASTGWRESERLLGRSIDELSGASRMVRSHWSGFMPRTRSQRKENGNALGDAATETRQLAARRLIKQLHTQYILHTVTKQHSVCKVNCWFSVQGKNKRKQRIMRKIHAQGDDKCMFCSM